jgi:hypothetical protein
LKLVVRWGRISEFPFRATSGYSYDDILLPLRHTILGVRNRKPDFLILVKPEVMNKIPGFTIAMTNKYKSTHGGKS